MPNNSTKLNSPNTGRTPAIRNRELPQQGTSGMNRLMTPKSRRVKLDPVIRYQAIANNEDMAPLLMLDVILRSPRICTNRGSSNKHLPLLINV
jgi:hypothetical protein